MGKPTSLENKPNHSIEIWRALIGRWSGTKRLWLTPGEPEARSESLSNVVISEDSRRLELDYDWIHRDRRQTAVITALLRGNGKAEMRWSDSFHTSSHPMKLKGQVDGKGIISVRGAYAVERGPDWGWRILLDPTGARSFKLAMYNVSPEGKEELAVEIVFRRSV